MSNVLILPTPNPLGGGIFQQNDLGQWIQVSQPNPNGGNTLVIPSQLYEPTGEPFGFDVFSNACPADIARACTIFAHDANLGGVFESAPDGSFGGAACGGPQACFGEDCPTWLADPRSGVDGQSILSGAAEHVNRWQGSALENFYPPWFISEIEFTPLLPPEREALGMVFDWLMIWCLPEFEQFQDFPYQIPAWTPPTPPPGQCTCYSTGCCIVPVHQ